MSLFSRTKTPAAIPAAAGTGPAISLEKVAQAAPGLVNLHKTATVSLQKNGLSGQRAAVYLVLDHSLSMQPFYANGSVQRLTEQTLALSANLDDDGTVPLVYFGSRAETPIDVRLDNYAGVVDATHPRVAWGSANYVDAMNAVARAHEASGATDPALVVFETDGVPDDKDAAERALRNASGLRMFWAFVGYGGRVGFLERLDELRGRTVDNASFFHAANPLAVADADLYDGITREYASWLGAAAAAGILR